MTQPSTPQEAPQVPVTFGSTVTILFSDIRGFTEFTDSYGDEDAYRMLQHHNSLVEEQISLYGGHIVKSLGDSFMVSFDSARTAITCAVGIQRALAQYNRAQQGSKIEIGIGINTGEPVRDAGDLFGGAVNLASRICAVAGSGQILVSETVRHVVGRMQGAEYIDRGFLQLKGFQEAQHLFEVDWAGVGAVQASQVAAPQRAVAPLPAAPSVPPAAVIRKPPPLVPILAGGLVVLFLLGVGGFFLLRPRAEEREVAPAIPPKEEALVAAPGQKLLWQDDFSDPGKGLFHNDVAYVTSGGQKYFASYEGGRYVVRTERKMPQGGYELTPLENKAVVPSDFWAQVEARALDPQSATVPGYGFSLWPEKDKPRLLYFLVQPDTKSYRMGEIGSVGVGTKERHNVPFINPGTEVNKLRIEMRGQELKLFVNDQLTEAYPILSPPGAERVLGLRLRLRQESEEETAIAFSRFMAGSLEEGPAAAPGQKLLFQDDFSDPAKGLFPPKEQGTQPDGVTYRQGYENGEYVIRLDGPSNVYSRAVGADRHLFEDFAVEFTARSLEPKQVVQYDLYWSYKGEGDFYNFNVNPVQKTFLLCKHPCNRPSTRGTAGFIQEETATKLRMELRGSRVRLLANDRLLDEVTVEDLARRGGTLALGVSALRGGAVAVAFDDFKVYALEEAPAAPTAETKEPAKGALLFQAKLDGTKSDVLPYTLPNPQAADIRFVPGAIEVVVSGPQGGKAGVVFNTAMRQTYVGEYDLSFKPGSDMGLWWELRTDTAKQGQYIVTLHALSESMKLVYFDMKTEKEEPLTPSIPVPGLRTGRVVTLTAAMGRERYMLFVDGQQVADVTDTRLTAPWTLAFTGHGGSGLLRIHGARVYALEEAPAAAPGQKLLFQDDFSDPAKGLFAQTDGVEESNGFQYAIKYLSKEYNVKGYASRPGTGAGRTAALKLSKDFAVEVEARIVKATATTHYEIQWQEDFGAMYVFQVSINGRYMLRKQKDSAWRELAQGSSEFIQKGKANNRLRMELKGKEIKAFVNGQLLATVADADLMTSEGKVSLYVGSGTIGDLLMAFDDFKVYALEEAPAVAVAEPTPFPTPLPTPFPTPLSTPVPPKPTPTAATKVLAPGDILYEDDPNDPAKRLFRKAEGTTPAGIAFKWGYEGGEYMVTVPKGSRNNGTYGTDLNFSFDYHYAVEAQVRAEGLLNKIRYGVVLRYAEPEHYGLQVTPSNGAWNVFYQDPSRKGGNLAGKHEMTPLANKGSAANLLRLEVRGTELKAFINGQLLGTANHEVLKGRPVKLAVGVWIVGNEDLKEGEGEAIAAFSRFKVYYLGGP